MACIPCVRKLENLYKSPQICNVLKTLKQSLTGHTLTLSDISH